MTREREDASQSASSAPLEPGTRVGPFEIRRRIGAGGMGEVYEAKDTKLGRLVALKFLRSEVSDNEQVLERFRVEARAASALNHPNICTIYAIEECEGRTFLAMELVEGQNLRRVLDGKGLPAERLLDLAVQIADGLEAAHERGVIHRDIKPDNLLVTPEDRLKILDFGLAKLQSTPRTPVERPGEHLLATELRTSALTMPGSFIGTPAYMSPEQIRGHEIDRRTDLFSLGAVLFEMAAGRPAFDGRSHADVSVAVLGPTPVLPSEVDPRLRRRLQEIVQKALEQARELRYQHASDVAADLRRLKRDLDVEQPSLPAAAPDAGSQPARPSVRRRVAADLVKAAVFTALVFGTHDFFERRSSGKYLDQFQVAFVQDTVRHGTAGDGNFEPGGRSIPVVVDIAEVHPDKQQRTDRRMLDRLIEELRRHGATAIGLDLIFDDLQGDDFQYFEKWTAHKNVRVGIYRRAAEERAAWLGRPEFSDLAAGVALPLNDPQNAFSYSRRWFLRKGLEQADAAGRDDCVGSALAMKCREDLIQLPVAMWLLSERQRISSEDLASTSVLEARLRASLETLQARSTARGVGNVAEFGEYAIDYSYLKAVQHDVISLSPGDAGGGWEAAVAGLAAFRSKLADRAVLVGDLQDPADHSCSTSSMKPVSGVLIHACALATLNRGLVLQITDTPGWPTVLAAGLCLVAAIVALRVFYHRATALQAWPFQYVQILAFGCTAILVFVFFSWQVRMRGIVWSHWLWLVAALVAHPFVSEPLYRTVTATRGLVRATAVSLRGGLRRV